MFTGQADLSGQFVFHADAGGPKSDAGATTEAKLGEKVLSWKSADGTTTGTAVTGSTFYLQKSSIRPNQTVVAGNGAFFNSDISSLAYTGNNRNTWSFVGCIPRGIQGTNGVIAMGQSVGGGSATNGRGFGLRPNWTANGFSGVDSYLAAMVPNGGSLSTPTNSSEYQLGAAGHWHNCVVHAQDPGSGKEIDGYIGEDVFALTATSGFEVLTSRPEFLFGGGTVYNGSTYTAGLDIEIAHLGVWDSITSTANAQTLAKNLAQTEPAVKVIVFGDSRVNSLTMNGTFQLANLYGMHFIRAADNGDGISQLETKMDAEVTAGRHYQFGVIWIGTNEFTTGTADPATKFTELQTEVKKGFSNEIYDHLFILNETPRGSTSNSVSDAVRTRLRSFSNYINQHWSGHPQITVIDSWSAVQQFNNPTMIDDDLTNDGTHFVTSPAMSNGSTPGYMRIIHDGLVRIMNERAGFVSTYQLVKNNRFERTKDINPFMFQP